MSDKKDNLVEGGAPADSAPEDEETAVIGASGTGAAGAANTTYAGWAYLGSLFAIFLVLAFLAYSADGDSSGGNDDNTASVTSEVDNGDDAPVSLTPTALIYLVDGDSVTLTGSVPDATARDQLVRQAREVYGDANVIDELTIDDGSTMDGGTISITGDAVAGDARADALLAQASSLSGMAPSMDVNFAEVVLDPVDAEFAVAADGTIGLIGVVPDEASRARLIANAAELYGADNVDSSGLTVDANTTWDGGQIRITGLVDPGDTLGDDLQGLLERDNAGVTVNNTIEVDSSAEALGRLQDKLAEELAIEPILFPSNRATISPESEAILQRVAAAMNTVPDIPVEIVGHTDGQGRAAANQALSEDRANAVRDRLVELGVDSARLSTRGAGEAEPIATNGTSAGRQQNRRIEFIFDGAS
jgi:OOP family OmpA-OmpF porin